MALPEPVDVRLHSQRPTAAIYMRSFMDYGIQILDNVKNCLAKLVDVSTIVVQSTIGEILHLFRLYKLPDSKPTVMRFSSTYAYYLYFYYFFIHSGILLAISTVLHPFLLLVILNWNSVFIAPIFEENFKCETPFNKYTFIILENLPWLLESPWNIFPRFFPTILHVVWVKGGDYGILHHSLWNFVAGIFAPLGYPSFILTFYFYNKCRHYISVNMLHEIKGFIQDNLTCIFEYPFIHDPFRNAPRENYERVLDSLRLRHIMWRRDILLKQFCKERYNRVMVELLSRNICEPYGCCIDYDTSDESSVNSFPPPLLEDTSSLDDLIIYRNQITSIIYLSHDDITPYVLMRHYSNYEHVIIELQRSFTKFQLHKTRMSFVFSELQCRVSVLRYIKNPDEFSKGILSIDPHQAQPYGCDIQEFIKPKFLKKFVASTTALSMFLKSETNTMRVLALTNLLASVYEPEHSTTLYNILNDFKIKIECCLSKGDAETADSETISEPSTATAEPMSCDIDSKVEVTDFKSFLAWTADTIDYLFDKPAELLSSKFYQDLGKILAAIIASGFIQEEQHFMLFWLGLTKRKDVMKWRGENANHMDNVVSLSRAISSVLRTLSDSDQSYMLRPITDVEQLTTVTFWLVEHQNRRIPDTSPATFGRVYHSVYEKVLKNAIKADSRLYYNKSSSISNTLKQLLRKSQTYKTGDRPVPFIIAMYGEPRVGKTTTLGPLMAMMALNSLGERNPDGTQMTLDQVRASCHTVNINEKYLSGYDPGVHSVLIIDEMGAGKKDIVGQTLMNDITSICGEGVYVANSAHVDDKGQILVCPKVIILISNSSWFGYDQILEVPSAGFGRHDITFKVSIKDKYRKADGIGINKSKVEDPLDVNLIQPMGVTKNGPVTIWKDQVGGEKLIFNLLESLDFVTNTAKNHHSHKDAVNATHDAVLSKNSCEHGLFKCPKCVTSLVAEPMGVECPENEYFWLDYICDCIFLFRTIFTLLLINVLIAFGYKIYLTKRDIMSKIARDIYDTMKLYTNLREKIDNLNRRVVSLRQHKLAPVIALFACMGAGTIIYKYCSKDEYTNPMSGDEIRDQVSNSLSKETTDLNNQEEINQPVNLENIFKPPSRGIDGLGNSYDTDRGFLVGGTACGSPMQVFENNISRNLIFVHFQLPEKSKGHGCYVLGIHEQFAVGPYHILQHFSRSDVLLGVAPYMHHYPSRWCRGSNKLVQYLGNDLCLIRIPSIQSFKDIRNFIPKLLSLKGDYHTTSGIMFRREGNSLVKESIRPSTSEVAVNGVNVNLPDYMVKGFQDTVSFKIYNGVCGSPYVMQTGSHNHITGIVVAGIEAENSMIFAPFDMEMLGTAIVRMNQINTLMSPLSCNDLYRGVKELREPDRYDEVYWLDSKFIGANHYLGSIDKRSVKKKSSVTWYEKGKEILDQLGPEYFHNKRAPNFNGYMEDGEWKSPAKNTIKELSTPAHSINYDHLSNIVDNLTADFLMIKDFWKIVPLDPYTAINGSSLFSTFKSMPKNTSAGFGFEGKKVEHLNRKPTPGYPDGFDLNDELKTIVHQDLQLLAHRQRSGNVNQMCEKDEPISEKKFKAGRVRHFSLVPINRIVITRMLYGLFQAVWVKHFNKLEHVAGVNHFNSDMWKKIITRLRKHPNHMAGDFKSFDKVMPTLIMIAVVTVINAVCLIVFRFRDLVKDKLDDNSLTREFIKVLISRKYEGLNDEEVAYFNVMNGHSSELVNPIILIDKMLFNLSGGHPSGDGLTLLINSIANSIYCRLAWYDSCVKRGLPNNYDKWFKQYSDNVEQVNMGDDHSLSVSDELRTSFNFFTLRDYFKSIGITYTNASKTEGSAENSDEFGFGDWTTATICKRVWRFDDEGYCLCPVEKSSVGKMLSICVVSKKVPIELQEISSLKSATYDLVQYGEEEFNRVIKILLCAYPEHKFPSFNEVRDELRTSIVTPWEGTTVDVGDKLYEPLSCDGLANQPNVLDTEQFLNKHEIRERACACVREWDLVFTEYDCEPPAKVQRCTKQESVSHVSSKFLVNSLDEVLQTGDNNNSGSGPAMEERGLEESRSTDTTQASSEGAVAERSNVVFSDSSSVYIADASNEKDSTYGFAGADNVPLGDFLRRPVHINDMTWNAGYATRNVDYAFDPWVEYMTNSAIKKKLANYTYLSGTMTIRFMTNGTPFQYGTLMAFYIPYGNTSPVSLATSRNQVADEPRRQVTAGSLPDKFMMATLRMFSTYPHVMIHPDQQEVVELKVPFLFHKNYLEINNISDTTSPGCIQIYDLNPLRRANDSASEAVNVKIYAMMDDIQLTGPTHFEPLSGKVKKVKITDEASGMISTPASAVAKACGALKEIKYIAPFARAGEIGAGAVAQIAKIFGFSVPLNQEHQMKTTLHTHSGLSTIIGVDNSYPLSADPRQEITVDPRTVCGPVSDEMVITNVASREQLLTVAEWASDSGQMTTVGGTSVIFSANVSPNFMLETNAFISNWQGRMTTPASWIGWPFEYWRGSVTFRLQVVASRMHSGRLKISFDPFRKAGGGPVVTDVPTEEVNTRYVAFLDLQESTEVEMECNYISDRPWLNNFTGATGNYSPTDSTDTDLVNFTNFSENNHIGLFTVEVVNELVAPVDTTLPPSSSTAPVQVNVFVRCGDDLEFAAPGKVQAEASRNWSTVKYAPLSGEFSETWSETHKVIKTLGTPADPNSVLVNFGESIPSIRALTKRFVKVIASSESDAAVNSDTFIVTQYEPWMSPNPALANVAQHSYLSFYTPGYIVSRGSVRFKITLLPRDNTLNTYGGGSPTMLFAERSYSLGDFGTRGIASINATTSTSTVVGEALPDMENGGAYTNVEYNPTLEVQLPYYNAFRFNLGTFVTTLDSGATREANINPTASDNILLKTTHTGVSAYRMMKTVYYAAGDDYSLSMFVGVPMVWDFNV